jgi:hypothetical protein
MLLRTIEEITGQPVTGVVIWNGAIARQLQSADQRPAPALTSEQRYPSVVALKASLTDTFEPAATICRRAGVFTHPGSALLHRLAARGHVVAERRTNPKAGHVSQPSKVWMYRRKV